MRKTWTGKSHVYGDAIVSENFGLQNVSVFSKTSSRHFQIPRFEERFRKLRFIDFSKVRTVSPFPSFLTLLQASIIASSLNKSSISGIRAASKRKRRL